MRILFFSRDYTPHDFRFLNAIAEVGHEVHFLRLEDSGRFLESRPLPASVRTVDWRWGKKPFRFENASEIVQDLRNVWDSLKPDVIHSGPLPDVSWLTAQADLHPHVAMSWGFDLMHDILVNQSDKERTAVALRHADWFLGDCFVERDAAVPLGLEKDHATIFPWGIDPARFTSGKSRVCDTFATPDDFVCLSLRSLEPNYSVETTLKAFMIAAEQEKALKLIVLADGGQMEMLRALADQAAPDVQSRILWLGRKPNEQLVDYYRASDIYLSASITDGSSVSLLEAMACEVPVLVSAIPGNLEWVEEQRTGFLFETGNVEQMAERLLWSYRNPEALRKVAAEARAQIELKADWNKNKFRLSEAYEGAQRVYHQRKGQPLAYGN